MNLQILLIVFIVTSIPFSMSRTHGKKKKSYYKENGCSLDENLREEIASYESVVHDILEYVLDGPFKGKTYDELSKFVDHFGARMSGTQNLEDSIDYMIKLAKDNNVNDVYTEDVMLPHWVRGKESANMLEPRNKTLSIIGLGKSVSTPDGGITAEVYPVKSFDELEGLENSTIEGKIVLFDPPYLSYGETVVYRSQGASMAAKKGAVASLVRSIAPFSINSPHTGNQNYQDDTNKIPTAAVTLEDADLIRRLHDRGEKIVINLEMHSKFLDEATSRNTIIDLLGRHQQDKLVIISGHIDSWDVGQGAMDDGGGLFVTWAAPVVLKALNLRANRTVRSIFWTGEELGLIGAIEYESRHRNESDKINFIMESDEGTFSPLGLSVAGTDKARCIISEVLKLFESINATELVKDDSPGSDIAVITRTGVPGAGLHNANERYFWFHHTEGDTMNVLNTRELDLCTAFWAAVAYVIADLSVDIPRPIQ